MIESVITGALTALQRLLGLALILAVLLNFANVVGRYGFGQSILWGDEVQMVILVVVTFLGAAIVAWRRQHLVMDMLLQRMPPPLRTAVRIFETLALVVIAGLVGMQSYTYAHQMFLLGRTSDNAGIPMWLPHSSVAIGFAMLAVIAVIHIVAEVRRAPASSNEAKS